jgi:hypothetical protein
VAIGAKHFSELTLSLHCFITLAVNRLRRTQPELVMQNHGLSLPFSRLAQRLGGFKIAITGGL